MGALDPIRLTDDLLREMIKEMHVRRETVATAQLSDGSVLSVDLDGPEFGVALHASNEHGHIHMLEERRWRLGRAP